MTRLTLSLLVVVMFIPSLLAEEPPATLSGVHAVYLNIGDLSARRDIAAALKRELPQVKVVRRLRDADAVIDLRGKGASEQPASTTEVAVSTVKSYDGKSGTTTYETKSVTVPLGQPTHDPGHMTSYAVRDNQELVLLDGLWTPAFATQTAARFIRAWRTANP